MTDRMRSIITRLAWLIVTAMVIYATWLLLKRFAPVPVAWFELLFHLMFH
ncbi:hypothetical protein [Lacticaseibacillus daqingensis]|nr:hypothetical protein [Lacticaseibacillus daqingensis]